MGLARGDQGGRRDDASSGPKNGFSWVSIRCRAKKRVTIDKEFMPIVFCSLEIHLPHSHSLKEKRSVLRKVVDRLRSRFNFSVSEIEHQELWQRARVGAVAIGPNRIVLEGLSAKFIQESERILGGDLLRYDVDIFEYE